MLNNCVSSSRELLICLFYICWLTDQFIVCSVAISVLVERRTKLQPAHSPQPTPTQTCHTKTVTESQQQVPPVLTINIWPHHLNTSIFLHDQISFLHNHKCGLVNFFVVQAFFFLNELCFITKYVCL